MNARDPALVESNRRFWESVDRVATQAFSAVPFVGPQLADFFARRVVPTLGRPRDRIILALIGGFRRVLPRRAP